jgi:hypothetical protein
VCLQEKIGKNTFNIVLQDIISSTQTTIKYDDILNIAIHGEDWISNKSVEKQFHENITKIQFDYNTC